MGVPLFQIQQLVNQHQIQLFSSNYSLYADMSARVMSTLEEFAPSLEVYSIDEAFLDLTGVCHRDPIAYGHRIRKAVVRATGIPVCVGMGTGQSSRYLIWSRVAMDIPQPLITAIHTRKLGRYLIEPVKFRKPSFVAGAVPLFHRQV